MTTTIQHRLSLALYSILFIALFINCEDPDHTSTHSESAGYESEAGENSVTGGEDTAAGEMSETAGDEIEAGETSETAGDTSETAGETSETAGEMTETAGEMTETAGEMSDDLMPTDSDGFIWYFGADAETNSWTVAVIDPTNPSELAKSFTIDELSALSGPEADGGNDGGPSWGDALTSTQHSRIFVNSRSVAKVVVIDTAAQNVETILSVGERPVHTFNPNHGSEFWVHADGPGAFYVIDENSLAVSEPVVAALNNAGHGKLLYAEELGTKYYATNTNDPGVFPIEGSTKTTGDIITLCDVPCTDDPETMEDESTQTCGSTHDKAYNPQMNYVLFQCSGDARGKYAFVDASTDEVVQDLVDISGSIAHTKGNEYILAINGDVVQIWDTAAPEHNGIDFDSTVTIEGEPSARGTKFRKNDADQWEAWIPLTADTQVAVLNLSTNEVELVEIGTLTKPEGARHFSRRAAMSDTWFFTYNDAGAVIVNLETRAVTNGPALPAPTSRMAFANPEAHSASDD